ncbi:MAG TPA: hypothetical protein VET89_05200 [Stellaceae bacterium]|nr:hypothetical protein [Stellaceae bacterium]
MSDRPIFLSRLALPVSWEALDRAPSPEDREMVALSNTNILNFLLHGGDLDAAQRPSDERLAEALAPLRIKLDIAIEMLGRLSYRDVALPPVRDIEIGVTRMAWQSPLSLRPDEWLRIKLYFDPVFLEPVVLYGRVSSAVADDAGGCNVQAELSEIPVETEEALARLAFLAQRRQLAHRPVHAPARAR